MGKAGGIKERWRATSASRIEANGRERGRGMSQG